MVTLSDLYDADKRTRDAVVQRLASTSTIPHPLNNVQYADGISPCRHAKKHQSGQVCNQEVRAQVPPAPAVTPQPVSAPTIELEWCELCSYEDEPFDEDLSPGVPQAVVRRTFETDTVPEAEWDPAWGSLPEYDVAHLSCGHTVATRA